MIFTIVQAGIAAAIAAGLGGPKINITTFKVGSAVAYTPNQLTDDDLRGDILYTGSVSNYHAEGANVVSYSLRMDETIGDFAYGEAGLYLADGTLFALGSLPVVQPKTKSAGLNPGNSVEIQAKLAFTNLPGLIDFTVLDITEAKMLEIASIDLLEAPIYSDTNCYICHSGDDEGNPVMAVRSEDYKWRFSTHKHIVVSGTIDNTGTNNTSQIASADIGSLLEDVQAGRYIIQFTTGAWRGLARNVSSSTSGAIFFATPLGGAPNEGDTFDVYVSDTYLLSQADSFEDDMLGLVIAFGSPTE